MLSYIEVGDSAVVNVPDCKHLLGRGAGVASGKTCE